MAGEPMSIVSYYNPLSSKKNVVVSFLLSRFGRQRLVGAFNDASARAAWTHLDSSRVDSTSGSICELLALFSSFLKCPLTCMCCMPASKSLIRFTGTLTEDYVSFQRKMRRGCASEALYRIGVLPNLRAGVMSHDRADRVMNDQVKTVV